jgi:aminoglycoside phosphotransferase (APT) family kinase protein
VEPTLVRSAVVPDPTSADPRWDAAASVAQAVAGVDSSAGVLIRSGTALLVRFGPLLIRAWEPARSATAHREVAVARTLAESGVPAVRLVEPLDQPVIGPEAVLTVWHWLDLEPGAVSPSELGALAGRLRRATVGHHDIPAFDPLGMVRGLLATTEASGAEAGRDLVDLARMVDDVEPAWIGAARDDPAGVGVVHGDLHRLNVLRSRAGPLLADLEMAGAGPPSYDSAPAAIAVRRYGADPADLDAFLAAAGHDPRPWAGFEVCCRVYELWVTAWALAGRAGAGDVEREAQVRMASLRGTGEGVWHLR